jgi:hypothetical protein
MPKKPLPLETQPPATAEFAGAKLPDARLNRRLEMLVEAAARDPSASLPKMMGNESEREAAYRFLSNARVEFDAVLQPHLDQSAERAAKTGCVLALHDTSTFKLSGSRGSDLGYINTGARGFFLHSTIAVENNEARRCLGLLKATTHLRETVRRTGKKGLSGAECAALEDRESRRWWEHVSAVHQTLAGRSEVIHVADSEADNFTLLSNMVGAGCRFVTRMARDRRARRRDEEPWMRVSEAAGAVEYIAEREVRLSARGKHRPPKTLKKFPVRDARVATLRFAAMPIQLKRPPYLDERYSAALEVNVVHVYEFDAPANVEPVEWFLFTTEAVGTRDEVLAVVDIYRRRWVIEEYFRAVKTGCGYEQRQLETRQAWMIALAITLPLAWRLLNLRSAARRTPSAPATEELSTTEIEVLRHLRPGHLSAHPTVRQATLLVAELGGHIKNNGEPGWLVLQRGLSKLQGLAEGVELGRQMGQQARNARHEM